MGTNYYWEPDACSTCHHREIKHIGKSSFGWVFALHVYPSEGINDLPDWRRIWRTGGGLIRDEYGDETSIQEMESIIIERNHTKPLPLDWDWERNYATPGPNNLVRSRIDGHHCVGHGAGTWDLHDGDFS